MRALSRCLSKWSIPALILAAEPSLAQTPGVDATHEQGTPRFELHWLAPEGCPTADGVVGEVRELMAGRTLPPRPFALVATALVSADAEGYRLLLSLRDSGPQRVRHIGAPTCDELGHAAALIIALALDPSSLTLQSAQTPDQSSLDERLSAANHCHCRLRELPLPIEQPVLTKPAPSGSTYATSQVRATPQPPQQPPKPYWRAGLSAIASFGRLPGLIPALGAFGAAQGQLVRAELSATFMSTDVASQKQNRFARFDFGYVALRVCALLISRPVAVGPCAGMELGVLAGQGHGVARSYQTRSTWLAATGGAVLELPLASSTFLALTAEVAAPLIKDTFVLAGETLFAVKPSGGISVSLGAGWP